MWVGGERQAPAAVPPGKRFGSRCTGVWLSSRAGLDGCGKSRPLPGFDARNAQPQEKVTEYKRSELICM